MAKDECVKRFLDRIQIQDGWCGAMEEIPGYVFKNYHHRLTAHENAAWSAIMQQDKALSCRGRRELDREARHREIAEKYYAEATEDKGVKELLDRGVGSFYEAVTARILKGHAKVVVINRCSRCRALCRTPEAKQCPACFHGWH